MPAGEAPLYQRVCATHPHFTPCPCCHTLHRHSPG